MSINKKNRSQLINCDADILVFMISVIISLSQRADPWFEQGEI